MLCEIVMKKIQNKVM